jgi:hypothetical protein
MAESYAGIPLGQSYGEHIAHRLEEIEAEPRPVSAAQAAFDAATAKQLAAKAKAKK